MNQSYYKALIAKDLAGETSALEKAELTKWISEHPDNARLADELARTWYARWNSDIGNRVDEHRKIKVLDSVMAHIAADKAQQVKKDRLYSRQHVAGIAGLVIFSCAVIAYLLSADVVIKAPYRQNVWLNDSSRIVLEKNSRLSLDRLSRDVHAGLDGDAYVELSGKRNASIIFSCVTIAATRASFTVGTDRSGVSRVSVVSGSVRITAGNRSIMLTSGEQYTIPSGSHNI